MVSTGFSEVIGSWNTMPMSPPRTSRISASDELHDIAAGETNLTLRDAAGRVGDQAQHRQRADRLAGAAFADDRHGLAGIDGVGDAVDRAHESRTGAELGVQIVHFQEWWQYPSPTQPL